MTTRLWSILLVIIGTLVASFAPILLKKASERRIFHLKSLTTNYPLFGSIFLFGLGMIIFVIALRDGDLSVLYPLSSLGFVWVSVYSTKFLGEKMNKFKWIGIILIIIGVSLIGIRSI